MIITRDTHLNKSAVASARPRVDSGAEVFRGWRRDLSAAYAQDWLHAQLACMYARRRVHRANVNVNHVPHRVNAGDTHAGRTRSTAQK